MMTKPTPPPTAAPTIEPVEIADDVEAAGSAVSVAAAVLLELEVLDVDAEAEVSAPELAGVPDVTWGVAVAKAP